MKFGGVMLPAVTDSNVKTLTRTGTILLSMVTSPCYLNWHLLLGTFTRSRKAPITFIMSVCLFARMSAVPNKWI
jgi:hypothetical protein